MRLPGIQFTRQGNRTVPNRYIRESAIESEAVNALSWQAEVFYRRLLNRVDDFGRFSANPKILRASLLPLQLDKAKESDIVKLMAECEAQKLIFRYEGDGKPLLVIGKWEKGRAATSKYAPPPANIFEQARTFPNIPQQPQTDSPDSDSDSDNDCDTDSDPDVGPNASASDPAGKQTDEQWLGQLSESPAYQGIDVRREYAKADAWCRTNRKQLSRRRFINWLNRIEQPMAGVKAEDQPQRRMSFA